MIIIGITGTLAAGKGAVVDYLVGTRNFVHYSMRDFLTQEIVRRGLPVNRDVMKQMGDEFRQKYSPGYLVEQFLEKAIHQDKNVIIESIRTVKEIEVLKKNPQAVLLSIDADIKIRYERSQSRKSATDSVTFEKFVEDEKRESISDEPWAMNLPKCKALADYRITNDGSLEELHKQIEGILSSL